MFQGTLFIVKENNAVVVTDYSPISPCKTNGTFFSALFQVKIWFQNRRSKYKKLMKTGPGGSVVPNMMSGGQPLPGGSPPPGGSPMMAHTPTSQGQMSPGAIMPQHSPGGGNNGVPPPQHQQQQHHQQGGNGPPPPPHSHGSYLVPQATPSPAGADMSPGAGGGQQNPHHHMGGSPPIMPGQWPPQHHLGGPHHPHHPHHLLPSHQQPDIKPPPMGGHAGGGANMFPAYSWYQTADNNMNMGLTS